VHFEHVAIRTMQPGDDDDLVTRNDAQQSARKGRLAMAMLSPTVAGYSGWPSEAMMAAPSDSSRA
jgi:hypothetical protein